MFDEIPTVSTSQAEQLVADRIVSNRRQQEREAFATYQQAEADKARINAVLRMAEDMDD